MGKIIKKDVKMEKLPEWKQKVKDFNEKKFMWIDLFVNRAIPWLVLLLLFIIVGEFSGGINSLIAKMAGHKTQFFASVEKSMHDYRNWVILFDYIVIAFFVLSLYFNFFRTETFGKFLRKYYLDIIAVMPFGLFFKGSEIGGLAEEISVGQEITHVTTETERVIIEAERGAKILTESEKGAKVLAEAEKGAKIARISRVTRLPRITRLWRLKYFFRKK